MNKLQALIMKKTRMMTQMQMLLETRMMIRMVPKIQTRK
jgi:hypothetical protein